MKLSTVLFSLFTALLVGTFAPTRADALHRLILPENRTSYYATEKVEIAVTNLDGVSNPLVALIPTSSWLTSVSFTMVGSGTQTYILPAMALAPSTYDCKLNGIDTGSKITIVDGVPRSTMMLSSAGLAPPEGGVNFTVGGSQSFGLLDPAGQIVRDPVGVMSTADIAFNQYIGRDAPTLITQYWPTEMGEQGSQRRYSWAAPEVESAMQLCDFHAAQRLRKYAPNIMGVGVLENPGLAWGRTPAGVIAPGFANWDEAAWWDSHGLPYTDNPGALSDRDWLKYVGIRTDIIKQNEAWAKQDIKTVWPTASFSSGCGAIEDMPDGIDPMNQEVDDVPTGSFFSDYGMGRLGLIGAVYLQKADLPTAKVAAETHGQVFGPPDPMPNQVAAFRLSMNALLAAGLDSNWWADTGPVTADEIASIHDPVLRYGPLFKKFTLEGHDVAILWSSTELAMREKDIAIREAAAAEGDSIKAPMTTWPENANFGGGQVDMDPYSVAANYRDVVLDTHQAVSRAGYAAQIVHEKLIGRGVLDNYRVLVIAGQTYPLPADTMKAIALFESTGGRVIVDQATTITIPGSIVAGAKLKDAYWRWSAPFRQAIDRPDTFASPKERSYYLTNAFMDQTSRDAALPMLAALHQTAAVPVFDSQTIDLAGERQIAGEGQLIVILNGSDPLPEIADGQSYAVSNYAPCKATYTLHGIRMGSVVYAVQGTDWKSVSQTTTWANPQTVSFDPGEMKLYLVSPRAPTGLNLTVSADRHSLTVRGVLGGVKMPWPLEVIVAAPGGRVVYDVYRSMDAAGKFEEMYPLGANSPPGVYNVTLKSPVGGFAKIASATVGDALISGADDSLNANPIATPVRVFDEGSIRTFLTSRPAITIVVGIPATQGAATKLEAALLRLGIKASVAQESQVISRTRYPRFWPPYITVYDVGPRAATPDRALPTNVATRISLDTPRDGIRTSAFDQDVGNVDLGEAWRKPLTLATVGADGYIDYSHQIYYGPGAELFIDSIGAQSVVRGAAHQVKTTDDIRQKWSRPWSNASPQGGRADLKPLSPESYSIDANLILLGDSRDGELNAVLQASELLPQVADDDYPGPGKALISMAWSPFNLGRNVIMLASSDDAGLQSAVEKIAILAK